MKKNSNRNLPFVEMMVEDDISIRIFKSDIDPELLVWHRDRESRIISCDHETDWKFQIDDELPRGFEVEIFIESGKFHRLIKGNGDLTLKIKSIL